MIRSELIRFSSRRPDVSTPSGLPHSLMVWSALVVVFLLSQAGPVAGQGSAEKARISEEVRVLQTYPFSEPNPVPILVRDRRLYPYHTFEGYAADPRPEEWKVVKLENDLIEVFVLPEVGGKVWGAVVKETGHEFIYRNEVMKFRNIALRGPWTSGGIEFNFGVIGHTPATATPVDYLLQENPDGSVSCFVGAMDLPSRTHWRVEIRLPADRAYFETRVLWYNPTPLEQPYYNWMTAAAFAQSDLEMSMPGTAYLQHSGQEEAWPVDPEGRYLPTYSNNTFGGHKSYHVVGELNDFFGGYYHDADYGFGHWARYEEMPGQKLWLWALSREGGVWEELLTDTDGQYVEFQAGRLFVQYSPGAALNPITQVGFDPMSASQWTETWFPLEGIGGLTDASRDGAMHLSVTGSGLQLGVNAFRAITDTLQVWTGDRLVSQEEVSLLPLQPFERAIPIDPEDRYRVALPGLGLDYDSDPSGRVLARPFSTDTDAWEEIPDVTWTVFQARELMKGREYRQARDLFDSAVDQEPWNREALLGLAELAYRGGEFEAGLNRVNKVLQLDAYDGESNFLAGMLYRALNRTADARDAFGWATRSLATRSAAYGQLAEIMIKTGEWGEAARYARFAIDFDRRSIPGWRALAVVGRKTGDGEGARDAIAELTRIDPLHAFARAESALAEGRRRMETFHGEYPGQDRLELAIHYANLGLREDALALLQMDAGEGRNAGAGSTRPASRPPPESGDPSDPDVVSGTEVLTQAWLAWLSEDPTLLQAPLKPTFTFPFRTETLRVLEWAVANNDGWTWPYLLGLNLWSVGRDLEAASTLGRLGQNPDFGPFYVARAQLLSQLQGEDPEADLRRAVGLDPDNRNLHIHLIRHLQENDEWDGSVEALTLAEARFPDDFNLQLMKARGLINSGRPAEAAEILDVVRVLPSENARESHRLFEQAHILTAMDAVDSGDLELARAHLLRSTEWPESLGQGRPYEPEERLAQHLLARVEGERGNQAGAEAAHRAVVSGSGDFAFAPSGSAPAHPRSRLDLLVLSSLEALGESSTLASLGRFTSDDTEVGRFAGRFAAALVFGSEPAEETVQGLAQEFPLLFSDLEGRMILRALTMSVGRDSDGSGGSVR